LQDSATNEIVVSKILADKTQIIVGQKIIASFIKENAKLRRAFKVVGIYNTGLEEYDRRFVIGDMGKIRDVLGWQKNEVGTLEIAIDHAEDTDVITEYIYTNYLPNNLHAESIQNKFPNIFEWLKLQDVNEKVILQLMTLVAIINMITVLLILILERTHMIGVLKSLGATNFSIRKVFLYQAAYMVMFGLLIGNIIGLSLCLLQKYTAFIKLDESSYYLDKAPILIQPVNIGLINLTAFAVIVIFLSIPTLLINKISPVQALKFD
jgi:lipoprotein-releasing system permease protein